jgi:hypothetical protein
MQYSKPLVVEDLTAGKRGIVEEKLSTKFEKGKLCSK